MTDVTVYVEVSHQQTNCKVSHEVTVPNTSELSWNYTTLTYMYIISGGKCTLAS